MHDTSRYRERWWGFRQVFESESFLADAREVVKTPKEEFEQALVSAAASPGFLDESGLAGTLTTVAEGAQRSALRNFISAFTAWRSAPASRGDSAAVLKRILSDLGDAMMAQSFDEPERSVLAERVRSIWEHPFPAVELAIKASRLVTDVGSQLDRVTLVCDLRPVFDDARTSVQGLIPLTTLKIVAHGEDATHPASFEVQLGEKELEELYEKVSRARMKVATLKAFVAKTGVVLPQSSMTEDGEPQS